MTPTQNEKKEKRSSETASDGYIYYGGTARRYRKCKRIVLAMWLLILAVTLVFFTDPIRAVQLRYLTKYWSLNPLTLDEQYHDILYSVGGGSRFAFYRDDIAVFGEERLSLYDLSGELVFDADAPTGKLSADVSGARLVLFSPGAKQASFYHSFAKEGSVSFPLPVADVCVSGTGMSAVCLKDGDGTRVALLNDRLETMEMLTITDGVVMDTALSHSGGTLCVLSLSGTGGAYLTTLSLLDTESGEVLTRETFGGKKPIAAGFFEGGGIYALTDRSLVVFRKNGNVIGEIPLTGEIADYYVQGDRLVLLDRAGRVTLFDDNAEMLFSELHTGVLDLKLSEDTVYLLKERTLLLCTEKEKAISESEITSGVLDFFILDDGSVLLCYPSRTARIKP